MKVPAIICDLDGTLALLRGRSPYNASTAERDALNRPVAMIIEAMVEKFSAKLILVSGREDRYRSPTERWLARHHIPYMHLYMRPEGDFRKDAIIKREIYEKEIEPMYDVLFVLDDRNQVVEMWRSLGLTCLQVALRDF